MENRKLLSNTMQKYARPSSYVFFFSFFCFPLSSFGSCSSSIVAGLLSQSVNLCVRAPARPRVCVWKIRFEYTYFLTIFFFSAFRLLRSVRITLYN